MCVSLRRHSFVVKVIKNGRREVKNSWTGSNGGHMCQANLIKFGVAYHTAFPDSYGV